MANIFFISDTHFGHEKTCSVFEPARPFANAWEMDEALVANWNSVVRPQDKVYHLGDVMIDKKQFNTLRRLNGHKRLVRGNHDIYPTARYMEFFDEVYGVRVLDGLVCTHIPIHKECASRFRANIHGHLHFNTLRDPFYMNVSVEQINYTPISLEDINKKLKQ